MKVFFDKTQAIIDPADRALDFTSREPSDSPQILQR